MCAAFSLAWWAFQCNNRHCIAGNLEAYLRVSSKLKLGTVGDEYAVNTDGGGQGQVKTGEQSLYWKQIPVLVFDCNWYTNTLNNEKKKKKCQQIMYTLSLYVSMSNYIQYDCILIIENNSLFSIQFNSEYYFNTWAKLDSFLIQQQL